MLTTQHAKEADVLSPTRDNSIELLYLNPWQTKRMQLASLCTPKLTLAT